MNQIPPHSIEAETCVIGSLVLDNACYADVRKLVSAEDFYRPSHVLIFTALCGLLDANKPVVAVSVKETLLSSGLLERAGGMDYVWGIVEGVPDAANAEYYAEIVRDKSVLRQLILDGREIADEAYAPGAKADENIEIAQQKVFRHSPLIKTPTIEEATQQVLVESITPNIGLTLGIPQVDAATGGLRGGNVMYLGGYTSVGKTTLAQNILTHLCDNKKLVGFVTLEMATVELVQRLMARESGVNGLRIRAGTATRLDEQEALAEAQKRIGGWRMWIDGGATTVVQIAAGIRKWLIKGQKPDLLIVDYVQLLTGKGDGRYDMFTRISRDLKMLAGDCDIPFLLLSQFKKRQEGSTRRPHRDDLKESGGLANDADYVLLIDSLEPDEQMDRARHDHWTTPVVIDGRLDKSRHGDRPGWPEQGGSLQWNWYPPYFRMEPI